MSHRSMSKGPATKQQKNEQGENNMADFVQNSQTKNAVRMLASPIEDVTAFNSIVQSVITDNPFECVDIYDCRVTHDPMEYFSRM